MEYNYLKKRLDVLSPLLEKRLRQYIKQNKAEVIQDNKQVLEVRFNCVTDRLGNKMFCKVLYDKEQDTFSILI